jgi:hypothetical protein
MTLHDASVLPSSTRMTSNDLPERADWSLWSRTGSESALL